MNIPHELLQSDPWIRFQELTGKPVIRCSDEQVSANGVFHRLPGVGTYLYIPRGPIFFEDSSSLAPSSRSIEKLFALARAGKAKWIRIEPESSASLEVLKRQAALAHAGGSASELAVTKAPHDMQPKAVFVVDISKSEEALLADMKPKTRYNIRLAEKKKVRVVISTDASYRDAFLDLVCATASRKHIAPHPRDYYEKMLDTFLGEGGALFVALHEEDILGINLVIFHEGKATYLHGGSSEKKRGFMAPFLLQWEAIREAKRRGCEAYDFGGIAPVAGGETSFPTVSSWAGITRFKMGFSVTTEPRIFPGCYDIILDRRAYLWYGIFRRIYSRAVSLRRRFNI